MKGKRLLFAFIISALILCLLSVSAFAEEEPRSGICGDGAYWEVTANGELIISGQGKMTNYSKTAPRAMGQASQRDRFYHRRGRYNPDRQVCLYRYCRRFGFPAQHP